MKNQKPGFEITHLFQILNSPRWLVMMFLLPMLMMAHFALAAPVAESAPASTSATTTADKFDHVKTGFNLTGAHATARCTSCHINNVFKGVARDCATCHRAANLMAATAKPTNHINTNSQCDTCHKTSIWTPALFTHVGMAGGACATCHNGTTALGKSRTHIPVPATISCDNCHKTTSWLQYSFSHKNINSGCGDCHGGQTFTGVPVQPKAKPNNHMLTSLDCGACHSTTNFVILKAGAPVAIPLGHFPTAQPCSVCHSGGSFVPGRMNHAGASNCKSCHADGTNWLGVTNPKLRMQDAVGHMSIGAMECSSCHVTSNFAVSTLTIPPAGHMPTNRPCATCHSAGSGGYIAGSGLNNSMSVLHVGVVSCTNCHGKTFPLGQGVTPKTKSSIHVPTARVANGTLCETCHNASNTSGFTSFTGTPATIMNHAGIVNACTDCHGKAFGGLTPITMSATSPVHIPTKLGCETCHSTSVFNTFSGAIMRHTGVVTCKECHNGSTFQTSVIPLFKAVSVTHNTANAECSGCHNTTTFMSATGGLPANHLTSSQPCSTCHATTPATMKHLGISSGCVTCHNGQSFAGSGSSTGLKPVSKANFPPHVSTALDCSSCHYPSPNGFSSFAGASGGALPLNHLPTTQPCSTCHTSFAAGSGRMNHVGIVSGCATCHDNKTFAVGMKPTPKPTSHIQTASAACEACHSISNFNTFVGDAKTMMKHTAVSTIACATCHGAGNTFIGGIVTYPSNHVPTPGACDTCHSKTNFTTFSGTAMNHTGFTTNCEGCHKGTNYAGGTPLYAGSNHIPYKTSLLGGSLMDCVSCHKLTTIGGFKTLSVSSTIMHNGSMGKGSGQCTGCHLNSGTAYLGVRGRMSLTHEAPGHTDCSDSGCHRPLGNVGTAYQNWN